MAVDQVDDIDPVEQIVNKIFWDPAGHPVFRSAG
jgi:hypothetical protein